MLLSLEDVQEDRRSRREAFIRAMTSRSRKLLQSAGGTKDWLECFRIDEVGIVGSDRLNHYVVGTRRKVLAYSLGDRAGWSDSHNGLTQLVAASVGEVVVSESGRTEEPLVVAHSEGAGQASTGSI